MQRLVHYANGAPPAAFLHSGAFSKRPVNHVGPFVAPSAFGSTRIATTIGHSMIDERNEMQFSKLNPLSHAFAAMLICALTAPVLAQQSSTNVNIVRLTSGWSSDVFHLTVDQPVINPGNCPTPDGYSTELAQSGYKTHYAAALLAFSMGRRVSIAVSQTQGACVHGRPLIIGISIQPQ
jgi:hypothetical protein